MAVNWNLLRTPEPVDLDVSGILKDTYAGQDASWKANQRNALRLAGTRMQAGDTRGAMGELYAGGMFNEGMAVDEHARKKEAADRDLTARIAFAVKTPDDLARVHSSYTSRGLPVPAELSSFDAARRHATAFAMAPSEREGLDIRRASADLERRKFDMTTPEYREGLFRRYVPEGAADPRYPGFVAGIPDKPPTTIKLGDKERLLEPPTPSRPGGYRDVTPERTGATADFGDTHKLRAQFLGQVKDYTDMRDAWGRIQASAASDSAASDMSMIFNYMKMLDPGSVVREGEYATAEKARGVPEHVLNMYNRIIQGGRLTASQRTDFVTTAGRLMDKQHESYAATRAEFERVARLSGIDPRALVDVATPRTAVGGGTAPTVPVPGAGGRPRGGDLIPGGLNPGAPRAAAPAPIDPAMAATRERLDKAPPGFKWRRPDGTIWEKRGDGWYPVEGAR